MASRDATSKKTAEKKNVSLPNAALHVFTLFGFAAVQPLLDVLSRHATFFVARRAPPVDILLMVVLLSLLIPSLMMLAELLLFRVCRRWWYKFHVTLVGFLIFVACLLPVKMFAASIGISVDDNRQSLPPEDLVVLAATAVLTFGLLWLYKRYGAARLFVTMLSPGILLFPALFLFNSPITDLVFPSEPAGVKFSVEVEKPAPVVFVILDELNGMSLLDENHRIDAQRYPHLAKLGEQATWFRNATTSAILTECAVPAILTGKSPNKSLRPIRADHPDNLFTLLSASHQLQVRELVTSLSGNGAKNLAALLPIQRHQVRELVTSRRGIWAENPTSLMPIHQRLTRLMSDVAVVYGRVVLPSGQVNRLPPIDAAWGDFVAYTDEKPELGHLDFSIRYHYRVGQFRLFVDAIAPAELPPFHFIHSLLPHGNWEYIPSTRAVSLDGFSPDSTLGSVIYEDQIWGEDELVPLQIQQRYLLQLGCVDRLVGELVDHLKAIGMYDQALIVLMSDHGVSFIPGASRRLVSKENSQDVLPILLMIKAPYQQSGSISDRNVESIDVVPTVADILGITVPWPVDGQSAVDETIPTRQRKDVLNGDNHLGFDGSFNQRFKSVERKLKHFGSGKDPHGLYRIGPFPQCVGRQIEEFEVSDDMSMTVHIENNDAYFPDLNRPRFLVPCLLLGKIGATKDVKRPVSLAFAVNGVIRSITRTYHLEGFEDVWSVMLPEDALQGDVCHLEAYVVNSSGKSIRLQRALLRTKSKVISGAGRRPDDSEDASS